MDERASIRNQGNDAESRFVELVKDSRLSDSSKSGDAIVTLDGVDLYVEIKECHANKGKAGTINQVRAIKYIPCVIMAPNHECWYVISPDQLVQIAAGKSRGQHSEIPFECMNFSLNLPDHLRTKCNDAGLSDAVHESLRRGQEVTAARHLMTELLEQIQCLRQTYQAKANSILS